MKKLILIVLGACCMASCKKFLEEKTQSDIVPETTEHFAEIIYSDGYPDPLDPMHNWTMFLDDDVECYWGPSVGLGTSILASSIFQWQADFPRKSVLSGSVFTFNAWALYYKQLLGANVVLQFIDDARGPQRDKDQIKGEAYALRAYYHFMLVNMYAGPYNDSTTTPDKLEGIPLRTNANLSEEYLTRNSVKEVYAQIESDLDSAVMLLSYDKKTDKLSRLSHVAAHLLASRVYLYEEKWEKAIAHADKVLEYHPQLMDLNTWGGMPQPEVKGLTGISNVESIWCYGNIEERMADSYATVYDLSHDLVNSFEQEDLRAQTGFYVNPPEMKPIFATDFSQMKFSNAANSQVVETPLSWRSAEAYLNRAEAYIQLYKTTGDATAAAKALSSLNTLRSFRINKTTFTAWTVQPATQLLQMCRDERRRELYLEEMHRWFDLRRYGMPSITHLYRPNEFTTETYRLQARDKQYILPLPDEVLQRNPKLTQSRQISGNRLPQ